MPCFNNFHTLLDLNFMAINLGKCQSILRQAVLNPEDDSIIDVGYLIFRREQSLRKNTAHLVKFPMTSLHHENYSKFIEKLTGITPRCLKTPRSGRRFSQRLESFRECISLPITLNLKIHFCHHG